MGGFFYWFINKLIYGFKKKRWNSLNGERLAYVLLY